MGWGREVPSEAIIELTVSSGGNVTEDKCRFATCERHGRVRINEDGTLPCCIADPSVYCPRHRCVAGLTPEGVAFCCVKDREDDRPGPNAPKILLVNDDPELLHAFSKILEREGHFSVIRAEDGLKGVGTLNKHRTEISAILLDVDMPRMRGPEAFVAMNKIAPNVPIVVLSSYSEREVRNQFAPNLPAATLTCPVDADALLWTVTRVLEARS